MSSGLLSKPVHHSAVFPYSFNISKSYQFIANIYLVFLICQAKWFLHELLTSYCELLLAMLKKSILCDEIYFQFDLWLVAHAL